jgi:hypothetical protein
LYYETSNIFQEIYDHSYLAASLGSTERSAHAIVTDPAEAGYVIKTPTPVPAPARQHQWCHLHHPCRLATQQLLIHASSTVWKPEI